MFFNLKKNTRIRKEVIVSISLLQGLFIFIISINLFLVYKNINKIYNFHVLSIENSSIILFLVSLILISTNTYLIFIFSKNTEDEKQQLIENLRKQRHDFINHLESLSYFLNNNETEEAQKYLHNIGVMITTQSQLDKIKNANFASVVNTFMNKCESKGIYFEFVANSELNNFPMSPVHVTTVFSNILNNALEHCDNEGMICLEALENETDYIFTISNTGQPINDQIDIFEPGVSTKGEGRGYGLSLVKETVENYNGEVYISDYFPPTFVIKVRKGDGNEYNKNNAC